MRSGMTMRRMVAIAMLWIVAMAAHASMITYTVSGTLDTSFDTLHAGDAYTMTYTVDTSIPLRGTSTLTFTNNVLAAAILIGSFSASATQGTLIQGNSLSHDQHEVHGDRAVGSSQIGGLDISYFAMEMHDPTGTALTDARLLADPSLALFPETAFWVVFGNGLGFVHGTIDRIAAVPEPGTLILLLLGLAAGARGAHRSFAGSFAKLSTRGCGGHPRDGMLSSRHRGRVLLRRWLPSNPVRCSATSSRPASPTASS